MLIRLPVPSCVNAPETTAVPAPLLLAAEFGSNAIVGNDLSSGIAGIYGGYRRLEREGGRGQRGCPHQHLLVVMSWVYMDHVGRKKSVG